MKFIPEGVTKIGDQVTPFTGVGIEIILPPWRCGGLRVTPFTGVGIEILHKAQTARRKMQSPPSRGWELKSVCLRRCRG